VRKFERELNPAPPCYFAASTLTRAFGISPNISGA
jgi:hypothetical protein